MRTNKPYIEKATKTRPSLKSIAFEISLSDLNTRNNTSSLLTCSGTSSNTFMNSNKLLPKINNASMLKNLENTEESLNVI